MFVLVPFALAVAYYRYGAHNLHNKTYEYLEGNSFQRDHLSDEQPPEKFVFGLKGIELSPLSIWRYSNP